MSTGPTISDDDVAAEFTELHCTVWNLDTYYARLAIIRALRAIATEVLEHCAGPTRLLSELNRVFSPGGFVFVTVPFLWPLEDSPYDEYRYTPFSLERHFRDGGFEEIRFDCPGGVGRRLSDYAWFVGTSTIHGGLSATRPQRLLLPVYRRLIDMDTPPVDFGRSCMITGLAATARK